MLVLVAVLAVQPAARAEEDRWDEDNWLWQYCGDTSCGQAWCVFSGPTFVGAPAPPTASRRRRSSAAPRRRSATPRSYCTGAGRDCPADGFEPNTKICRASVGPCDVTDKCTGFSNDCPADTHVTDGLACAPGSKCLEGGTCGGGACSGGTYELSFGPAAPALADGASQVVTITHSGSGAAIQLTGASVSPAEFTLAAEPTWPVTLASGQSTAVTVRFDGAVVGDFAGERAIEAATDCPEGVTLALGGTVSGEVPAPGGGGGGCASGSAGGLALAFVAALGALRRRRARRGDRNGAIRAP